MPRRSPRRQARSVQLTALTPSQIATMLSRASGIQVPEAWIQEDVAAGAPVNPDGTMHVIHYAAWLVRALADGR